MDAENAHVRKTSDAKIRGGETDGYVKCLVHTLENLCSDSQ